MSTSLSSSRSRAKAASKDSDDKFVPIQNCMLPLSVAQVPPQLTSGLVALSVFVSNVFQMQHDSPERAYLMAEIKKALGDEKHTNYTINIPLSKQLISYFEFDVEDKVCNIRFIYQNLTVKIRSDALEKKT